MNSLTYCAQEVMTAAQKQGDPVEQRTEKQGEPPFAPAELARHFAACAERVRGRFPEIAASLDDLRHGAEEGAPLDLEEVERRLTVLEEMIFAGLVAEAREEQLLAIRREMDTQLAGYRRKMPAAHLALVEKQFLHKKLLEQGGLPRLSLFYL